MRVRTVLDRVIVAALFVMVAIGMASVRALADEPIVVEPIAEGAAPAASQDGDAYDPASEGSAPSGRASTEGDLLVESAQNAQEEPAAVAVDVQEQVDEVQVQVQNSTTAEEEAASSSKDPAASGALTTQGSASNGLDTQAIPNVTLVGRVQVQRRGWMSRQRGNAITMGTTGKSLRLETLELGLEKGDVSGSIIYQAHVQRKGWMAEKRDGQKAGTVGKSLRLEALKIRLTDDLANAYDVWYRVHVQGIGWLAWACNGEAAGTEGFSKRIESLDVAIVAKGQGCPGGVGATDLAFVKGRDIYRAGLTEVSGDVKLDMMLDAFVKQKCGTNGEGSLRKAYKAVANYGYRKQDVEPKGSWQKWSISCAKDMYTHGSGNCYRYASLMCWVARRIGYDAKTVAGYVYNSAHQIEPHAWCEVNVDGKAYVIDSDMYRYHRERNWFMVTYAQTPIEYLKHK